jgi:hypothetical protein
MEIGKHTVEHLMINPNGTRFCFLHRFPLNDGGIYSRLLTADLDGSNLYLLTEGAVSHLCWRNNKQILAWTRDQSFIPKLRYHNLFQNSLVRWILKWGRRHSKDPICQYIIGDSYRLFTDCTQNIERIGTGILNEDGHCSFSPNGHWILTDTYPDKNHNRTLILYHLSSKQRLEIGRFYSSPNFVGILNCDLHPRWNRIGTQICIDSTHEGDRQIYVIDVEQVISEKI